MKILCYGHNKVYTLFNGASFGKKPILEQARNVSNAKICCE